MRSRSGCRNIKDQIPPDVELTTIDDQSQFIRNAIRDVKVDAVIGGMLAILIIFLFLRDGWSTFVVGLSLPVSIIATFFFMGRFGLSLNVMSLGGLALATGLVVDDSIVVLESIAKARERGLGILDAAVAGTREVSMAVVASTLTTIAVFLPLVFVQGIAGQLFRDQALTVALAIGDFAGRVDDADPDAERAEGPPADGVPGGAAASAMAADVEAAEAAGGGRTRHRRRRARRLLRHRLAGRAACGAASPRSSVRSCARPATWRWRRTAAPSARTCACCRPRSASAALVLGTAAVAFVADAAAGADARRRPDPAAGAGPLRHDREAAARHAAARHRRGHRANCSRRTPRTTASACCTASAAPARAWMRTRPKAARTSASSRVVMADGGSKQVEAAETERLRRTMQLHPNAQVDFSRPELFSFSTPLEIEITGQDLDAIERAGKRMAALLRGNAALRRRQVDGRAGLSRDPDPLRPGARRARSA